MNEKTIGYTLLFTGIGIMLFAAAEILLVFTNQVKPLAMFNSFLTQDSKASSENMNELLTQLQEKNSSGSNVDNILPALLSSTNSIIPPQVIDQTLNLTVYFFLMSFLLGFGYKIATLGVQLVRPVYVKLKAKEVDVVNTTEPS